MADILPWNQAQMSVGVAQIDSQHRKLVDLLNKLNDGMKSGKGSDTSKIVLGELFKYTQDHFATEEKLMKTHGYPGSSQHQDEHVKLLGEASKLEEKIIKGSGMISIELITFLKKWLTNHILGEDKKFGAFLNSKGVK